MCCLPEEEITPGCTLEADPWRSHLTTGLKGYAAVILVPEIRTYLQRSCGVRALTDQSCFAAEGDLHNVRQLILMLWLICVCCRYLQQGSH